MGTLEDKRRAVDEGTYQQNWQTGQEFIDTHPGALDAINNFNRERHLEGQKMARDKAIGELKIYAYDNRIQLAIGGLFGIVIGMTIYNPNEYSKVLEAFGSASGNALSGVGSIIRGIGEVIPG